MESDLCINMMEGILSSLIASVFLLFALFWITKSRVRCSKQIVIGRGGYLRIVLSNESWMPAQDIRVGLYKKDTDGGRDEEVESILLYCSNFEYFQGKRWNNENRRTVLLETESPISKLDETYGKLSVHIYATNAITNVRTYYIHDYEDTDLFFGELAYERLLDYENNEIRLADSICKKEWCKMSWTIGICMLCVAIVAYTHCIPPLLLGCLTIEMVLLTFVVFFVRIMNRTKDLDDKEIWRKNRNRYHIA